MKKLILILIGVLNAPLALAYPIVVVVGGGPTGLAGALTALQAGATEVHVLEQRRIEEQNRMQTVQSYFDTEAWLREVIGPTEWESMNFSGKIGHANHAVLSLSEIETALRKVLVSQFPEKFHLHSAAQFEGVDDQGRVVASTLGGKREKFSADLLVGADSSRSKVAQVARITDRPNRGVSIYSIGGTFIESQATRIYPKSYADPKPPILYVYDFSTPTVRTIIFQIEESKYRDLEKLKDPKDVRTAYLDLIERHFAVGDRVRKLLESNLMDAPTHGKANAVAAFETRLREVAHPTAVIERGDLKLPVVLLGDAARTVEYKRNSGFNNGVNHAQSFGKLVEVMAKFPGRIPARAFAPSLSASFLQAVQKFLPEGILWENLSATQQDSFAALLPRFLVLESVARSHGLHTEHATIVEESWEDYSSYSGCHSIPTQAYATSSRLPEDSVPVQEMTREAVVDRFTSLLARDAFSSLRADREVILTHSFVRYSTKLEKRSRDPLPDLFSNCMLVPPSELLSYTESADHF